MTQDELNQKLIEAVDNKNITEIKSLLNQGANVNAQEKYGWTPLHWAALNGYYDVAKLLIENGADVNIKNNGGWTPLHEAAFKECYDIVKLLIDNGADVNTQNEDGTSPLHISAMKGYRDIIKYLIENGADVNVQDKDGWAPLHYAAFWDSVDIIKLLIENGVDPFIKNKDGKIPLDYCKNQEVRQLLEDYMKKYHSIQEKIKRNESSIFDNDLLDSAYYNNLIEVKKCVYSGKFDINVQDDKGYTPLMYAISDHNLQMVEFLVEHGADINLCNNKGQSPLKIAYLYNSEDIAEYLLEKGAIDKNVEDRKQTKNNENSIIA